MTEETTTAPAPTTPTVVTNRERLSGVVQAVGRRPADIERRWWESAAIFFVSLIAFTWFGHWMISDLHVVGFETLDRFNRALMIWHNDPPKLAAVGFDYPPLSILLISPFTVFSALARSLLVIPLGSSIFAAMTFVFLNTMMRRAQVAAALRVALLIALACNPLVAMYASSGSRHFIWLSFAIGALGGLFAWYVTADIRFVMIAGLAYSVASLSGYTSLIWFLLSAIMVAAILSRLGADGTEVEGTTVGFAAPTVYVITLWTLFNLILIFRPFNWITASSDRATGGGEDISFLGVLEYTFKLVFNGAPIALIVLPALLFAGIARRNGFALWMGLLLLVTIISPGVSELLGLTDSPMLLRNALPILLVSIVGALWLARSAGDGSTMIAGLTLIALLISIPWTFDAMKTYKYQGMESVFVNALSTRESQEGAKTLDESTVGIQCERQMSDYIRANISKRGSVLTDNAQTSAVILMTGQPELFFDRVDKSDGPWRDAALDPAGKGVEYMLLTRNSGNDLLSEAYAEAADGENTLLPQEFVTCRYILVSVPAGFKKGANTLGDPSGGDE